MSRIHPSPRGTGVYSKLFIGLCIGLICALCCTSEPESLPLSTELVIELHWDAPEPEPADGTLRIENDLGVSYHIDTGYLISFSVEFLFCEEETTVLERLWSLFGVAKAYAGHGGDETLEQRRFVAPLVEDLRAHESVRMGTFMPMDGDYCSAFYLIGRAEEQHGIANLPTDVDMVSEELSMILQGTYTLPGSSEAVPFIFSTRSAQGRTDDLTNGKGHISPLQIPTTSRTLHISRNLDTMLDGVDLSVMDHEAAGIQIIGNLVEGTNIQVVD